MSKFWTKVIFWENVKKTCAVFGGPATAGLSFMNAGDLWVCLSGGLTAIGAVLAIWVTDYNKNGIVDLFENEKPV